MPQTGDADRTGPAHGASVRRQLRKDSKLLSRRRSTAPALRYDRVCNWFDELTRVATDISSLPPGARRAVSTVLVSLRHEAAPDLTLVQARGVDDVLDALSRT